MPAIRTNDDAANQPAPDEMLPKRARQLTRIVDMFWMPSDVVALGLKIARISSEDEDSMRQTTDKKKLRLLALHDKLVELEPTLFDDLGKGHNAGAAIRNAKSRLSTGQSNGKSEDMRKVKDALVSWQKWTPSLADLEKTGRGLAHPECAYHLSPPDLDWNNDSARLDFVAHGNPPMESSRWPRFLWEKGSYNPLKLSVGLLRGELLIKAARAILFSPSASKSPATNQVSGARGNARRRGPIGIAKSYQLTEVTPAFLAYVAVVVRHALTADEVFSDNCSGFDYVDFYNQLREFLETPKYRGTTTILIDWWNTELFAGFNSGSSIMPSGRPAYGTLARLEAEAEGSQTEDESPDL